MNIMNFESLTIVYFKQTCFCKFCEDKLFLLIFASEKIMTSILPSVHVCTWHAHAIHAPHMYTCIIFWPVRYKVLIKFAVTESPPQVHWNGE